MTGLYGRKIPKSFVCFGIAGRPLRGYFRAVIAVAIDRFYLKAGADLVAGGVGVIEEERSLGSLSDQLSVLVNFVVRNPVAVARRPGKFNALGAEICSQSLNHVGGGTGRNVIASSSRILRQIQKYQFSASDLVETDSIRHELGTGLLKTHASDACTHLVGCGRQKSARINHH